MSTVNSAALQSFLQGGKSENSDLGQPALPPASSKNSLDFNFVPNNTVDLKKSGKQYSIPKQETSASHSLSNPPYWVIALTKTYEAIENNSELPCAFKFPVADGSYFWVANLDNLVAQGDSTYSGNGVLIYNLPDTANSVSEFFVPISFSGWSVQDGETVEQGNLQVQVDKRMDSLPAMTAHLKQLTGVAGV